MESGNCKKKVQNLAFSVEDEPRDDNGRWTDGGGVGYSINGIDGEQKKIIQTHINSKIKDLGIKAGVNFSFGPGAKGAGGSVGWANKDSEGKYKVENRVSVHSNKFYTNEQIISHELKHIQQSEQDRFYIKKNSEDGNHYIYWEGKPHTKVKDYNSIVKQYSQPKNEKQFQKYREIYTKLPWEVEADNYAGTNQ